ncbi:MAG: phage holin family protein [Paludibacter sp.]
MTAKTDNSNNGFQQFFAEIKEYVSLQTDYLQVGLVEKLTKLLSKLILALIGFVFVIGTLFFLLFSVAYALAPILGFVLSFAIIGVFFVFLLLVVVLLRKQLIVNPLLRIMIDVFYEDPTEKKLKDEDNSTTL